MHRIADCTCRVAPDRYEIKVVKRKGHRIIHINIQIFQTPEASKYMIECRRTQGNIFKYHEFFEEFQKQFNNVIQHLHKTNPDALNPISPSGGKRVQIKFRNENLDQKGTLSSHDRSVSANLGGNAMENAMTTGMTSGTGSRSVPVGQTSQVTAALSMKDEESAKVHRKSSASSASSLKNNAPTPSHHSSISEASRSQSEQKENLNLHSSASPTPTHQQTHSNGSSTLTDEELNQLQPHSDSSLGDEMEVQKDANNELKPVTGNRHRRSSSGQGKTYSVTKHGHLGVPSKAETK